MAAFAATQHATGPFCSDISAFRGMCGRGVCGALGTLESMCGRGEMDVSRLRWLRLVNVMAPIGAGAAIVWFGFAAADASGAQMAAASAMFAAVASGWAGAFAAINAKLRHPPVTRPPR